MSDTTRNDSDLDKFIELYASVGIELRPEVVNREDGILPNARMKLVLVEHTTDPRVIGYNQFITEIYFDEAGKFVGQGIWE